MGLAETTVVRRTAAIDHDITEAKQVAIFDSNKSELVVLNEIGGVVWRGLDGTRSLRGLAHEIATDVPSAPSEDAVLQLVVEFVGDLVARGLAVVVE